MAKSSRRGSYRGKRNRKGFVAIPFSADVTLGAAASDAISVTDLVPALGEDAFCISVDTSVAARDLVAGEGPLTLALCHGDLTSAEVKEALEAEVTDPGDIIAAERARRPVRRLGTLLYTSSSPGLNNGDVQRTTLKFRLNDGSPLRMANWNRSSGPLTTGGKLRIDGTLYARWEI